MARALVKYLLASLGFSWVLGAQANKMTIVGIPHRGASGRTTLLPHLPSREERASGRERADKNFSEQLQSSYRAVTDQLQISYRSVTARILHACVFTRCTVAM